MFRSPHHWLHHGLTQFLADRGRQFLRRGALIGAVLCGTGAVFAAPPADANAPAALSVAEQRLFTDPHLASLPADATVRYAYRKAAAGQSPVNDEVVLKARQDATRGRVASVDYLHGERRLELPEIAPAVSNPLILYFLESDVRAMKQHLGGQENYFRRRIRLALADHAEVTSVPVQYAGKTIQATRVTVRPYLDDPLKDRFKDWVGKSYVFTLSDQVPSGVLELRTVVEGAAGSAPLDEVVLSLQPGAK